ncbi:NUDIX hydrolase [Paenibacillus abyssi]|uniref:DNA mismatch repair protein MutT n=1 Tax=Paenibacillus abyssi TaxID=1340531 RepID=A0A917LCJ8_9BACL|nr:NUDIX hydrolase [Paenibacillus abyssi]GGG14168.1 DNA mismatch repair protein MutT [Paenibacillus abyssi]
MGYVEELRAIVGHRPLILVGAVVIIVDNEGRILLQQRKHPYGKWGIPGGLMELGESTEITARREIFEETNLKIGHLHLINVYSGPDNFVVAANGDQFYVVVTAYYTKEAAGELINDHAEALKLDYFHPDRLPADIVKSHKKILEEFIGRDYKDIL